MGSCGLVNAFSSRNTLGVEEGMMHHPSGNVQRYLKMHKDGGTWWKMLKICTSSKHNWLVSLNPDDKKKLFSITRVSMNFHLHMHIAVKQFKIYCYLKQLEWKWLPLTSPMPISLRRQFSLLLSTSTPNKLCMFSWASQTLMFLQPKMVAVLLQSGRGGTPSEFWNCPM